MALLSWPQGESAAFLAASGREAALPLDVGDAGVVGAVFWADLAAARALVAPAPVHVAEIVPGRTVVTLVGVDYRDNPWGVYHEAAVLLPVGRGRPIVAPWRLAQLVYRMPVDQAFTMHAGRERLGLPKQLGRIDVGPGSVRLELDGAFVFSLRGPTPRRWGLPVPPVTTTALGVRHGEVVRFQWSTGGRGLAVRLGGPAPELGDHPLADDLRALGLPRRPLLRFAVREARLGIRAPGG